MNGTKKGTKASKAQLAGNAKKLLKFLEMNKKNISPLLIMTHDYPDPDALASAVTLQHIAEHCYRIQSKVVYGGIIGRTENKGMVQILKLPVHKLRPYDFKKYQHVVLVDTQPKFENNSFPPDKKATMVIDQHPSVTKPQARLSIVDPDCGATSVILAKALLLAEENIPSQIATSLAYGIISDTMNLYRAPYAQVIETYLQILPYSDMKALAHIQNPTRSRRFFTTLGKGIQKAKVRRRLIVSHLGAVENPDLVSQITDFFLTYKNARYACCTGRYKGRLYVSLRNSKSVPEAAKILRDIFANRGEAGGHGAIAGGSFEIGEDIEPRIWDDMEEALIENLARRLRIPKKSDFSYPFRQRK